jgi:adenosylcobinamide-GDP ribazoletransferase
LDIRDILDDVARSVAFLSRVHVPQRHFINYDGRLSRAVRAFPAAGVLITLPATGVFSILLALGTDGMLAALVFLTMQTMVTGALHEDGLSDSIDGLGGGKDRESILAIMRDSRIGTYGTVALILAFALRASALVVLSQALDPTQAGCVILAVAAISRAMMVWHWSLLPPARKDGVAASVGEPDASAAIAAYVTAFVFAILLLSSILSLSGLLLVGVLVLVSGRLFANWVKAKIGGHTGDTLGASLVLAEMVALVTLAVWL